MFEDEQAEDGAEGARIFQARDVARQAAMDRGDGLEV
jgi:hypothetical protein